MVGDPFWTRFWEKPPLNLNFYNIYRVENIDSETETLEMISDWSIKGDFAQKHVQTMISSWKILIFMFFDMKVKIINILKIKIKTVKSKNLTIFSFFFENFAKFGNSYFLKPRKFPKNTFFRKNLENFRKKWQKMRNIDF